MNTTRINTWGLFFKNPAQSFRLSKEFRQLVKSAMSTENIETQACLYKRALKLNGPSAVIRFILLHSPMTKLLLNLLMFKIVAKYVISGVDAMNAMATNKTLPEGHRYDFLNGLIVTASVHGNKQNDFPDSGSNSDPLTTAL